jgi:hypothetical protein
MNKMTWSERIIRASRWRPAQSPPETVIFPCCFCSTEIEQSLVGITRARWRKGEVVDGECCAGREVHEGCRGNGRGKLVSAVLKKAIWKPENGHRGTLAAATHVLGSGKVRPVYCAVPTFCIICVHTRHHKYLTYLADTLTLLVKDGAIFCT